MRRRLLVLLLLTACSGGGGNSEPDPNPDGCATREDCARLERCVDSTCRPAECDTDADCGLGDACEVYDGFCYPVNDGCRGDFDCGSQRCWTEPDGFSSCVDCLEDADCEPGHACDLGRHSCYFVGCTSDAECDGQRCDRNSGLCVECVADADCPEGTCDREAQECVHSGCEDDALEPNDTRTEALPLAAGILSRLVLCPRDTDQFLLELNAGDGLTVDLTSAVDLHLELRGSESAELVAAGEDFGSGERLVLSPAPWSDEYLLTVRGADDAAGGGYALDVILEAAPSGCRDDAQEDNDGLHAAAPLALGTELDLFLCPGDPDLFAVTLNTGDDLRAGIDWSGDPADIELALLSPAGVELTGYDGGPEFGRWFVPASGTHRLRIVGADPTVTGAYQLRVSLGEPTGRPCDDDLFEEDDDAAAATLIGPGALAGLMSCPGDMDYFRVPADGGGTLTASLDAADPEILALDILAPNGVSVLASGVRDGDAIVAVLDPVPGSGEHVLRVQGLRSDGETGYDLQVGVGASANGCTDDAFEENDGLDAAAAIGPGVFPAVLCPTDPDTYVLAVNAGDRLAAQLDFDHAAGDIDLALFGPDQTLLDRSWTVANVESVVLDPAPASGAYYLLVTGWGEFSSTYDLTATLESSQGCADDPREDDDTPATAGPIPGGELFDLVLCPGDDDVYVVPLDRGDRAEAGVFVEAGDGSVDVAWLAPGGATVLTGVSGGGDQVLELPAVTAPGPHYLRVSGRDLGGAVAYGLLTEVYPADECADDGLEPNDGPEEAPWIAAGTLADLRLCYGDDDFYRFEAAAGAEVLASVEVLGVDAGVTGLVLSGPDGALLDLDEVSGTSTAVVGVDAVAGAGTHGLWVVADGMTQTPYTLELLVSAGADQGHETVARAPAEPVDEDTPVLLELGFDRVPAAAVVERVIIERLSVVHGYVGDLLITAAFGDGPDTVLWNEAGGEDDGGLDDDAATDDDIELLDRALDGVAGLPARDTLLLLFEDGGVGDAGVVVEVRVTVQWRLP